MAARMLVSVIDDDQSVREALPGLLGQLGFDAKTYSSGEDFLTKGDLKSAQHLLLDVAMPGMSGPDVMRELKRQGHEFPIIFITGHADQSLVSQLLSLGAVECLIKPFDDQALLNALTRA